MANKYKRANDNFNNKQKMVLYSYLNSILSSADLAYVTNETIFVCVYDRKVY